MATTSKDTAGVENTVVGVYDDYHDAEKAVQELVTAGFERSRMQLTPESEHAASQKSASSSEEQPHGIGAFFRNLFALGEEHKEHHDVYAESVRRGSFLLTLDTDNEEQAHRASEIMNRFNAVDVNERAGHWKKRGWSGYDAGAPHLTKDEIAQERSSYAQTSAAGTSEKTHIPVIEEVLKVGKRIVQRGGIRIFTRVKETPVEESVQLREEHVTVERQPVDKPATQEDVAALKEGSMEVREMVEEPVVAKGARVVEEIQVGKEVSQRTEEIKDTVRRTEVEVQQLGTAEDTEDFRRHWQTAYGSSGGRYEDYDAAYRYGSTMAGSGQYKNYQWTDVEPQLRSDWESSHPGSTWDKVKDAVRYGAERVTGKGTH